LKKRSIKTDGDIVAIAKQLDYHRLRIKELLEDLEFSEHPNAEEIGEGFREEQYEPLAWATHVISHYLLHPEKWETGDRGIRYKGKD
jgi:hypothetical protein